MTQSERNRAEVRAIKEMLGNGKISYEEALDMAKVVADRVNKVAIDLARRYGCRPRKVTPQNLLNRDLA